MRNATVILITTLLLFGCKRELKVAGSGLLLPNKEDLESIPLAASAAPDAQRPKIVDIGPNLPPAGFQGGQGSCVGWSIGYGLISYYEKSVSNSDYGIVNGKPDGQKVFSPSFIYNYVKAGTVPRECSTGILYTEAFDVIKNAGVCRFSFLPNNTATDACYALTNAAMEDARRYRMYKFERILKKQDVIESYLFAGYPVIAGIFTSDNLKEEGLRAAETGAEFIWNPARQDRYLYHSVLIVGYDANRKLFKLLNSWGQNWGMGGYVYIPYDRLFERLVETYISKRQVQVVPTTSNFKTYDVQTKAVDTTTQLLTQNSIVSFENFSLKVFPVSGSRDEFNAVVFDSTKQDSTVFAYLNDEEEKQFYIRDSLITIQPQHQSPSTWPVRVKIKIDSGGIDPNIFQIDSLLDFEYTSLKKKESLTENEERLLKEFQNRDSGYKTRFIIETERYIPFFVFVITLLVFAGISSLYLLRKRKQKVGEVGAGKVL